MAHQPELDQGSTNFLRMGAHSGRIRMQHFVGLLRINPLISYGLQRLTTSRLLKAKDYTM
jgi:hypothetical protein